MRESNALRLMAALTAVLCTATTVHAQCTPAIKSISQPAAFPSQISGPIATDGVILGVAKHDTGSSAPPILFATYDNNLNPLIADRQVAVTSANGPASLFWADTEFGLFFQRTDATLVLQRIDRNGNSIGAPIAMPHFWSFNDEFDVSWDHGAGAYAVAHFVTGGPDLGLWLSMVTPAGNVLSDVNTSVFASIQVQPRVTTLADGTAAMFWTRSSATPPPSFLALLRGTGVTTTAISNRAASAPVVASNGSSVFIIFSAPKSGGGTELRYAIVNSSGNLTTADSSLMSGSGSDIAAESLFWNPALSEWALGYLDAIAGLNTFPETRLRRFTSPSATPSDTLLSPDPLRRTLAAPFPVVFLNNGYIGSIRRVLSQAEGSESYLVRLCPFVAAATADHPIWRPFLPVTFTASGSGGSPGYTFQWQFGDNDIASGTVVSHIYLNPGTYTVTLTGTDAAGATSVAKITVQITTAVRQRVVHH